MSPPRPTVYKGKPTGWATNWVAVIPAGSWAQNVLCFYVECFPQVTVHSAVLFFVSQSCTEFCCLPGFGMNERSHCLILCVSMVTHLSAPPFDKLFLRPFAASYGPLLTSCYSFSNVRPPREQQRFAVLAACAGELWMKSQGCDSSLSKG